MVKGAESCMKNFKNRGRNKFKPPAEAEDATREIARIKGVSAVYLFGSYAKGTQRPYSDIDICAITGKIDSKTKDEIFSISSKKIETRILSELPLNIQFRVFQEGRPLKINSWEKLLETRFNVMRAYQDFRPRLEKYWRWALEKSTGDN